MKRYIKYNWNYDRTSIFERDLEKNTERCIFIIDTGKFDGVIVTPERTFDEELLYYIGVTTEITEEELFLEMI